MIGAISGNILDHLHQPLLIMVNGVGYDVMTPARFTNGLIQNQEIFLYIHTHVKEDAIELYGFATFEERMMFRLVLSISGIGPKTALHIVNFPLTDILNAIRTSDVEFFTQIPRLGKKNAQKIIIELKSKIGDSNPLDLSQTGKINSEVFDALLSMGFKKPEIQSVLDTLESTIPQEEKLRRALKKLGSHHP